jgi:CBS domain-containing protein
MYEFLEYRTSDVMTLDPMRVSPETSLGAAMEIFDSHDFNGLPVLAADGELVGIVTKLDVLRAFRSTEEDFLPRYDQIIERPVAEVMTRNPQVVTPRQHLSDVLGKLVSSGSKSFPVVDAGRLVGIVAREDVLRGLRRASMGEAATGTI